MFVASGDNLEVELIVAVTVAGLDVEYTRCSDMEDEWDAPSLE